MPLTGDLDSLAGHHRGGIFQRARDIRAGDGHLKVAGASLYKGCQVFEVPDGPELSGLLEVRTRSEHGPASLDVLSRPKFKVENS